MPRFCSRSVRSTVLFLLCLIGLKLSAAPNVLVLVSYHPGYSWSDGELQGLLRVMNRTFPGAIPSVEYLDTNRNPDPARTEFLFDFIRSKYKGQTFDVVITLDDAALQTALRHRDDLGSKTPIVFCGVNNFEPRMIAGVDNITGVSESFDFTGNIELILRLRPWTKTIHVISDTAASTQASRAAFARVVTRYAGKLEFKEITGWTAQSLMERLAALPPRDSALIIGNAMDATGRLVSEDESFLRSEAAKCAVPIFMVSQPYLPISEGYNWDHAVWYGVGGRVLTSDVQGEAAARLAVRILRGEAAGSIPVELVSPTRCALHYPQLVRHGIDLSLLPPDAELFDRPTSFYQQYKARILLTLSAIGVLVLAVLLLIANILKRRKAERAYRVAIERFEMVARATNEAVWDLDLAGAAMWWNDGYKNLVGIAADEVPSRDAWERAIHPEDRARVFAGLFDPGKSSSAAVTMEHRVVRRDGGQREVLLRVYFLRDPEGKPLRAVGSMLDLTQHRATERQLLTLATAVTQASEIVVILDEAGLVEYANSAFTDATGLALSDALGRELDLFVNSAGHAIKFEQIVKAIGERGRWIERLIFFRAGREPLHVQVTVSSIHATDSDRSGYLVLGLDVSTQVRLEEQVRLGQKMDAIGTLAGGVAHDFNNMLQVITGNAALAIEEGSTAEQVHENLLQIREAASRAGQLTRQLLLFGRRQPPQAESVDLRQLTTDMLKLLDRVIGENYKIVENADEGLWPVHADKGQLEQVLMNLCVNARDAMPGGGKLEVGLKNVTFTTAFCDTHAWAKPGEFTRLAVSDSGCGMDQVTLGRIFEPFFSTKPKDKGTGLGLSVVFGIVEQHGGFLHVESRPGQGSRFEVYLPRALARPKGASAKVTADLPEGHGTVLLIEDEESVRQLMLRVLKGAGYRVISASDGNTGIALGVKHVKELSLVVLDVILPNASGLAIYEKLAPMRPDLPFLFCSGYSADVLPDDLARLPNAGLLEKPFEPEKLLREVQRRVLQATPV